MVKVEEDYRFTGPDGRGHPARPVRRAGCQLMVSHFMFDPEWDDGCPSCTAGAEEMSDGLREHLATRDTTLAYVSRAPIEKIEDYKRRKGWTFPWYSSFGSALQLRLPRHARRVGRAGRVQLPRRRPSGPSGTRRGRGWSGEQPGTSASSASATTCSTPTRSFGRGAEWTGGSYAFLDLTALGRQEDWEEPTGRSDSVRANTPDFAS